MIPDVERKVWAECTCGCAPGDHQVIVLRPISVEQEGKRVLFEGTLGACTGCPCDLYTWKPEWRQAR